MLRIGLTGGIGSGKSTVAQIFEALGIPVYYADAEAKRLMNTDAELKKSIISDFGEAAYKDGVLNRSYIASIVFNDKTKLDRLNSLVHPAVMKDGELWMSRQTTPYAIHEAALIFEAGVAKRLDYVIGVFAPQPLRIKRTTERDKISHEEVAKRMSRQLAEEIKMKRCDFIITNDEQQPVIPQVMALHEKLLALSKQK
jgi:dephospho-CoA kinase